MLTIYHVCVDSRPIPYSILTIQRYFGMVEWPLSTLDMSLDHLSIYSKNQKQKQKQNNLHPVNRDHRLCLMIDKDNLWPVITFTGVSTWFVVYMN